MSKTKLIFSLVVIAALGSAALASAAGPAAATRSAKAKTETTVALGPHAEQPDSRNLAVSRVDAARARAKARAAAKAKAAAVPSGPVAGVSQSTLDAIAACESGGDPTAANAGGYYGKYQFDLGTWASVGGTGNPADASEGEQDYRASVLYERAGSSPWPVCGQ